MLTFLKKLGQILLKANSIAGAFGPVISATAPGAASAVGAVSSELEKVADIVISAEVMGQALGIKGPDKLKAAAPLVAQVVLKSSLLARHEIANEALFMQGCTKVGDGMADILNSLKDEIPTVNKA